MMIQHEIGVAHNYLKFFSAEMGKINSARSFWNILVKQQ